MSREETLRLKAVISCKLCKEPCNKAVSLACCGSASCRKCALAKLREDKTKCWGCGELSTSLNFSPSQLLNNDLVRIGVSFFNENQSDRVSAPFEIFVLLTACSKNDEDKTKRGWYQLIRRNRRDKTYVELYDELDEQPSPQFGVRDGGNTKRTEKVPRKLEYNARATKRELAESEKDQLALQLLRNKRNKTDVDLYGEPDEHPSSHFGVRNIFTGTGSRAFNRELGEGKRKFDNTSIQKWNENGTGRYKRYKAPWNRGPRQPLRGQAFVREGTGGTACQWARLEEAKARMARQARMNRQAWLLKQKRRREKDRVICEH